ncbi:hypothetical protein N0V88_006819 [Collariella sp. IMI 366227]|nr:hypothetical protein N0V88_006819 [Collariella sp. IMI 366227]
MSALTAQGATLMAQNSSSTIKKQNGIEAISLNTETLWQLNSLVSSAQALSQAGYIVRKLTNDELEQKKRCPSCRLRSSDSAVLKKEKLGKADDGPPKPQLRCNFHPGSVMYWAWTCCDKNISAPPCAGKEDHDVPNLDRLELERRWQFHATPSQAQPSHRAAVAIDCEMGTAFDGDSELIRLTVIDYFTGETLIDSLVYPNIKMTHFNTRYSGITKGDMEQARRQRTCILGRDAARKAVFNYVGPSTIVVGHGAQSDLSSLRWIHYRMVDSHMVEVAVRKAEQEKKEEEEKRAVAEKWDDDEIEKGKEEVDKPKEGPKEGQKRGKQHPDGTSLKALAMRRLGRVIQIGKKGHDSLEDALAARDLIHAHIMGLGNLEG